MGEFDLETDLGWAGSESGLARLAEAERADVSDVSHVFGGPWQVGCAVDRLDDRLHDFLVAR